MSTKNLYNEEAKEKLKNIVEDVTVAMMATDLGKRPISVVPMHTKRVDDDGTIWFLSAADSDHNTDITRSSAVQLLYSDTGSMKFLSIYGEAIIITDHPIIEELYSDLDNAWFDGPNDKNVSAIKFTPREAAYWSNDHNKLVTLFKLGMAAVTGDQKDIGTSGKLNI